MEKSSFKASSGPSGERAKLEQSKIDGYDGKYRQEEKSMSADELLALKDNPLKVESLPAKGLKSAGG